MAETAIASPLARHRVAADMRGQILAGRWRPGTKLRQEVLARELGVSRIVIREALFELQTSGLVELTARRGASVRRLDPERMLECLELRELHDGLAARQCCKRMTLDEMRSLRETATKIRSLHQSGRRREGAQLDRQFHRRLIEISRHAMLRRLMDMHALPEKQTTLRSADPEITYRDHVAILDAIAAGDADLAEQLARTHVRRLIESTQRSLATDGGADIESIE